MAVLLLQLLVLFFELAVALLEGIEALP